MRSALLAALLALAPSAGALQSNVGSSAAEFLRLGAGARALGMAEAYTAVAEGPDAVYWNPAGLSRMTRPEAVYSRSEMPAGLHQDFVAVGLPSRFLRGTVAFAVTRFSQESLDRVDSLNRNVGSFSPHSEVYSLGYGHRFSSVDPTGRLRDYFGDHWNAPNVQQPLSEEREPWTGEVAAGLALKVISDDLGTRRAAAFAVDGGGLFRPEVMPEVILAGAFRHLGSKLRYISDSAPLPTEFAAALAYEARMQDWHLLPALEAGIPIAGDPYAKLGCESMHRVARNLWAGARLGFSSRNVPDLGAFSGLTGGVGLRLGHFTFDGAFQPMAVLGETFRLGVGWRF